MRLSKLQLTTVVTVVATLTSTLATVFGISADHQLAHNQSLNPTTIPSNSIHPLAADGIAVSITKFNFAPARMFYFENSEHVLMQESSQLGTVWHSGDEGKTWAKASGIPADATMSSVLIQHKFAKATTAIVLTRKQEHYITTDRGLTWRSFSFQLPDPQNLANAISFHATRPSYIMYRGRKCNGDALNPECHEDTYYTTDDFKTSHLLLPWTSSCIWAQNVNTKATDLENTILCTEWPANEQFGSVDTKFQTKLQLVKSDQFFKDGSKTIIASNTPLIDISFEWLLSVGTTEAGTGTHMSISKDASVFVKAVFPQNAGQAQKGYTVLESSSSSLFVDVLTTNPKTQLPESFGTLYKSDSDGTYFIKSLEHTNRNLLRGEVDFERISSSVFDGILIANTVANWREISDHVEYFKRLASVISFDNGGRWMPLAPPATDLDGKPVFSTVSAAGILLGVGSVGPTLNDYGLSDTFMSDDAGLTWKMVMKGPAKFEIMDMGAVIVLVPDSPGSSQILYSWNRGKSWESLPLMIENTTWSPIVTLIDPDSTSQRMLVIVNAYGGGLGPCNIIQLDFEHLQKRKCDLNVNSPERSKDFELWTPRSSLSSKTGECLLGQSTGFYRIKADADCYVGEKFKALPKVITTCACSDSDYECDIEFEPALLSSSTHLVCELKGILRDQPLGCKEGQKYMGKSGYRIIPGDKCKDGDQNKKNPVERICGKPNNKGGSSGGGPVVEPPVQNQPVVYTTTLSDRLEQITYIKDSSIVLAVTRDGQIWRSADEGVTWSISYAFKSLLSGKRVLRIGQHESTHKRTFIFTHEDIFVSDNSLDEATHDIKQLVVPEKYNAFGIKIIDFHPDKPDWYVYVAGGRSCGTGDAASCHTTTYMTKDAGNTFTAVDKWSNKCLWARDFGFKDSTIPVDAIICSSFKYKDGHVGQDVLRTNPTFRSANPAQLVLITNEGRTELVVVDSDVFDFFVVDGIMVVDTSAELSHSPSGSVASKLIVSTDAQKFVDAKFPPMFSLVHSRFTILESTTGGIFLDAELGEPNSDRTGMMFKSNENGVFFSKVLGRTHRSAQGQVDFEKINDVPGVILTNMSPRLGNQKTVVQTLMSFSDGSSWSSLTAPAVDSTGAQIVCESSPIQHKCDLQLHGITSVTSTLGLSALHSSKGAPGLLIGVGNPGESLFAYNLGNVFLSRDAGHSWIEVRKDAHKWAIADYGGLIVLVNDEKPVNTLSYSWDFGATWAEHKFSDQLIRIEDVATKSGAESRKVLITGHYISSTAAGGGGSGGGSSSGISNELATALVSVDFEHLFSRKCDVNADFELWYPGSMPGSNDPKRCFFGEEVTYRRRKADAICYVGAGFSHVVAEKKTCECIDSDYECDYNFFRNDAGMCSLYSTDPDQPRSCPLGTTYEGSSGYRKISLSRCKGGKDLTAKITRDCGVPGSTVGKVAATPHLFVNPIDDFYYFNQTGTIIAKDSQHKLFISRDQGKTWSNDPFIEATGPILAIISDPLYPHRAFLMTSGINALVYTNDNGKSFAKINTPLPSNMNLSPNFLIVHPTNEAWLLFIGSSDCAADPSTCHTELYVTFNFGSTWALLDKYVSVCHWLATSPTGFKSAFERGVICSVFRDPKGNQHSLSALELVQFDDAKRGGSDRRPLFSISGFAIYDEYLVTAVPNADSRKISVQVSIDGSHWAEAYFPDAFLVRSGYTVLPSESGSVFLHIIESTAPGREHGTLMKSNWNGTYFQKLLTGVNQNRAGYVDLEKIEGVSGSIIANQVSNIADTNRGDPKKIQTRMSFDDGLTWNFLKAPKLDSNHKEFDCEPTCYLHLHAYTERHDPRDLFSSSGSIGFMMGVGNVGPYLRDFNDGDTFLTRDGGHTWIEVTKEAHMYEFGDHGGIIVLVNDEVYTDVIKYSLDSGATINEIRIGEVSGVGSGGKIRVTNILTDPSGTTSRMIVMGKLRDGTDSSISFISLQLDFDTVWPRKCVLNRVDESKSDYEGWTPSLLQAGGGCVFGTNTTYFRRKANRECLVGQALKDLATDVQHCDCQMSDFECGYGYHSNGNLCVSDADPLLKDETCNAAGILQGYRQRKISQCVNANKVLPPSPHCTTVGYISSIWSWIWMTVVALGIAALCGYAALYYRTHGSFAFLNNGGFSRHPRYGPVQLPIDTDGSGSLLSGFNAAGLGERIGTGLRSAGLVAIDTVVGAVVVVHYMYDWVRTRVTRTQGYAPVRTTVAGRYSFDDDNAHNGTDRSGTDTFRQDAVAGTNNIDDDALDLDWGDEEEQGGNRH
ncbi:hypothetical protein BASA83_012236 [Batrachochytrium salamandrivorans]|nr:hypothetical protein BASA83_012236 [Batrachochytrium salamandrivorans]